MKTTFPKARIGVSLVVALVAGGTVWRALIRAKNAAGAGPVFSILAARRAVPAAHAFVAGDLEVRSIPAAFAESGIFHDMKELGGSRSRVALMKGEFITRSKIETESSRLGLAWSLPAGQTALSLRLPAESAIGGHALPGDWVRILGASRASTETVVPRARVVAVQDRVWDPGGAPPSPSAGVVANETFLVTLMLTPNQAVHVVSAADRGHLTLALLSPIDEVSAGDTDDR